MASLQLFNQETEQSLVSLALHNGDLAELCSDKDFYVPDHQLIWKAIQTLSDTGIHIDPVTVASLISRESNKDLFDYLAELYSMSMPIEHADSYSKIILEHAFSRQSVSAAERMKSLAAEPMNSRDKASAFNSLLSEIDALAVTDYEAPTLAQAMTRNSDQITAMNEGSFSPVYTGLREIDLLTNGFFPGDLIVIAGRPGMGKTALAMNIAENIAVQYKTGSHVFSLEMSATQLGGRFACSMASINTKRMRNGDLTETEWGRYGESLARAESMNIVIDDRSNILVDDMRRELRKRIRRGETFGCVIVDYMQIIRSNKPSRYEAITEISGALKSLAKEFGVPVIALSQLSREVEKRADKRPTLADLRESGAIEQDADVVILAYRDDYYHKDSPMPGKAEAIIEKNRAGTPGVAVLDFKGEFSRFTDVDELADSDRWTEVQS